jgi:hypothetical protein
MTYDEFSLPNILARAENWVPAGARSIQMPGADCRATAALEGQGFSCRRQLYVSHCSGVRRRFLATGGKRRLEEEVWERGKINGSRRRELERRY